MTQQQMNLLVPQKLNELEQIYGIKVLYAAETGSRAWGLHAPDSDFDIRFIYVHQTEHYLRLDQTKDTVSLPVDSTWDLCGWDLPKALRLLHGSNPSLFEWAASPIVYRNTDIWHQMILPVMREYFQPRTLVQYHLSMADRNEKTLYASEYVKVKLYFYLLRSVLASQWAVGHQTPPPILFDVLAEALPPEIVPIVNDLLMKRRTKHAGEIPHIPLLDQNIADEIRALRETVSQIPQKQNISWQPLNDLFVSILKAKVI